jgi:hypothetical protein
VYINAPYVHSSPGAADEPTRSAFSILQTSGGSLDDTITDQIPDLETEVAATESREKPHLTTPSLGLMTNYKDQSMVKRTGSSPSCESLSCTPHLPHDARPCDVVGQAADKPYKASRVSSDLASIPGERDLKKGELSMPRAVVSTEPVNQAQNRPQAEVPGAGSSSSTRQNHSALGRLESILEGSVPAPQSQSLIDSFRSIVEHNGEESYRKYAMGYNRRKRYGWFAEAAFNRIATASSNKHQWWLSGSLAVLFQHLISRWVYSGHRKCFRIRFYNVTAVYLLQNVGDPSDRWLNDTLKGGLGLCTWFLDEHIALVYDGNSASPSVGGLAQRQLCPHAWHIWATLSDQQTLNFSSCATTPPTNDAAQALISFQRTATDSCEFGTTR